MYYNDDDYNKQSASINYYRPLSTSYSMYKFQSPIIDKLLINSAKFYLTCYEFEQVIQLYKWPNH